MTMFMPFAGRTPTGDLDTCRRQIVTGKSYLRAKDKDRKKVDRQTRKFRPLTEDVVRGHLVGDHTSRNLSAFAGRDLLVPGG